MAIPDGVGLNWLPGAHQAAIPDEAYVADQENHSQGGADTVPYGNGQVEEEQASKDISAESEQPISFVRPVLMPERRISTGGPVFLIIRRNLTGTPQISYFDCEPDAKAFVADLVSQGADHRSVEVYHASNLNFDVDHMPVVRFKGD